MQRYSFSYRFEAEDEEIWLRIPKLPGLVSAMAVDEFRDMSDAERKEYVSDAVIVELQAIIATKSPVPEGDEKPTPQHPNVVSLTIQQSIKLELYKLYRAEFRSVAEFARHLDKSETLVRRMLDLRHKSSVAEIEDAIEAMGRRLVLMWDTEMTGPSKHTARLTSKRDEYEAA